jgi:creatinine amidohydrolase
VIPYGFEDHHMSFPGTITIRSEHLEAFVLDITLSLAHHGFRKILIADGHGSNMPILDLAGRKTIIQSDALCACFIWPSLISDLVKQTRESPTPGGMSHACELETSVYLHLNEGAVQMDKARAALEKFRAERPAFFCSAPSADTQWAIGREFSGIRG